MDDSLIELPGGSFVRPSHIKAIYVVGERADREYLPGNAAYTNIACVGGGHICLKMPSDDAARAEAARIAALCKL